MNKIISLTTAAEAHIKKMIEQKSGALGFRLSVKQTGCTGYMYVPEIITEIKEGDIKLDNFDFAFFIDKSAEKMLNGIEIDYVNKSLGVSTLIFNNPNAKSLCGCGESFNLRDEHE